MCKGNARNLKILQNYCYNIYLKLPLLNKNINKT